MTFLDTVVIVVLGWLQDLEYLLKLKISCDNCFFAYAPQNEKTIGAMDQLQKRLAVNTSMITAKLSNNKLL